MPITTKTLLTRAQRRTILRLMLRDSTSTVWPDAVLNYCLDEGLTLVQARFPLVKSTIITLTTALAYDLPAECLGVISVQAVQVNDADLDSIDVMGLTGLSLSGTTWSVSANTYARMLVLNEAVTSGDKLLVWYRAAQQPWGDPSDTGLDTTTKDLIPTSLQDGEAPLLLYAGARVAAYRYAAQIIAGGGSAEYEALLRIALAERDELSGRLGARPSLHMKGGFFS